MALFKILVQHPVNITVYTHEYVVATGFARAVELYQKKRPKDLVQSIEFVSSNVILENE